MWDVLITIGMIGRQVIENNDLLLKRFRLIISIIQHDGHEKNLKAKHRRLMSPVDKNMLCLAVIRIFKDVCAGVFSIA